LNIERHQNLVKPLTPKWQPLFKQIRSDELMNIAQIKCYNRLYKGFTSVENKSQSYRPSMGINNLPVTVGIHATSGQSGNKNWFSTCSFEGNYSHGKSLGKICVETEAPHVEVLEGMLQALTHPRISCW
jgi:hypothetical protein